MFIICNGLFTAQDADAIQVLPSKGQATAHRGQTLLAAFRDPDGKAAAAATAASTAAGDSSGLSMSD